MGCETSKCFHKRMIRGDFENYLVGKGLDVGSGGDLLRAARATVEPWDLHRGDAHELHGVDDACYDFVYSSHCLEHLQSVERALKNWVRVLKPGGFLYLVVPDYSLYEKECFPSRHNPDHKQTFSLHLSRKTVKRTTHWHIGEDVARFLATCGVEIKEMFLENDHYNYSLPDNVDQTHDPKTLAQICVIGRKTGSEAVKPSADSASPVLGREAISQEPYRIYTGILGQIGDIVMFSATVRRLKQLFPRSAITFAVSRKYVEAGELLAGLPYIDRLFVAEYYFEKLSARLAPAWYGGWPVDLRGEDEVAEQKKHDIVFETRPRSRRSPWWEVAHQVEECAHMVGVPGPMDLRTEIAIPSGTGIPAQARKKIVIHNDPSISAAKAWPWGCLKDFVHMAGPENVVLLGNPGPSVEGVFDLRGQTTLAQAALVIKESQCYVGIDSGLMWIAASLAVPAVGLYGTSYIPAYTAIQPINPRASYIQVEGTLEAITAGEVLRRLREKLDSPSPQTTDGQRG